MKIINEAEALTESREHETAENKVKANESNVFVAVPTVSWVAALFLIVFFFGTINDNAILSGIFLGAAFFAALFGLAVFVLGKMFKVQLATLQKLDGILAEMAKNKEDNTTDK